MLKFGLVLLSSLFLSSFEIAFSSEYFEKPHKIIILGSTATGKTSLLMRYKDDIFSPYLSPSIGVDFTIVKTDVNNKEVKLIIWDTAGFERFKSITRSYFKGVEGIILVYDICDEASFQNLPSWMEFINKSNDYEGAKKIALIIAGNKSDLKSCRQVSYEEGLEYAQSLGVPFFETSAKKGVNVKEIFSSMAEEVSLQREQLREEEELQIKIIAAKDSFPHKGRCCFQ